MFHRLSSLWRRDTWIRPFLRESRRQVLVSLALGAGAVAFACALMFTSGYLISLAAERPELGVWALFVPLAFVQIFGLGKPALGYFERLSSHDWVLRMTSALRLRLYTALESSPTWTRQSRIGRALGLLAEDIGHVQHSHRHPHRHSRSPSHLRDPPHPQHRHLPPRLLSLTSVCTTSVSLTTIPNPFSRT